MTLRTATVGLLCALSAAGCLAEQDQADGSTSVERHRDLWKKNEPAEYVLVTKETGIMPGFHRYAVVDGKVIAAANRVYTLETPWEPVADVGQIADPIQGTFDQIEKMLGDPSCKLTRLTFDEGWGYVSDHYEYCHTENGGVQVVCFGAGTTKFDSACVGE